MKKYCEYPDCTTETSMGMALCITHLHVIKNWKTLYSDAYTAAIKAATEVARIRRKRRTAEEIGELRDQFFYDL